MWFDDGQACARGTLLALHSVHRCRHDDAVSIRQNSRQCQYKVDEQREQAASCCDAKDARDEPHRANLLLVFFSEDRVSQPPSRRRGKGVRSTGPLGGPHPCGAGSVCGTQLLFWGFPSVDDAFARGDRVLGNQSRPGCLSSYIADRCVPVSCRSMSTRWAPQAQRVIPSRVSGGPKPKGGNFAPQI